MDNPSLVRRYLTMLSRYLKPQWFQVLLIALTMLLASGEQLVVPQIIRVFIDTAGRGGETRFLLVLALSTLCVTVLGQASSIASTYFSTNVAWRATNEMRRDLVRHCLSLDMSFHHAHTPGEMIERIDSDVAQLATFFSQLLFHLLSQGIVLIVALAFLFTIAWFIGVTVTFFVIAAFVFLATLQHKSITSWEQYRQTNADVAGFLGERLGGIDDIRANGAVAYTMLRFLSLLRPRWSHVLRASRISQIQALGLLSLLSCASLVALAQGAYLWYVHLATLGTVYLIASYTAQLAAPIEQLHGQFQNMQQVEACVRRIHQLVSTTSTQHDGPGCVFSSGPLSLAFEQVAFGYVAHKPVLRDISFQLQPGKVLGLLGRTGSGKTTITRLLFRFDDPQKGVIWVDGKPLKQAKLHDLRQRIGIVTQSVQLFRASVRDNLTFFDHSIPDKRILEVLEDVGLIPWYRRLPDGLEARLGPEGTGLSAGEAQLLAFTRIFLSDPGIVILDEASSRLDPATESLIERAMDKLLCHRTAIIIAHRLRTIQRADNILLLDNGTIREYGEQVALAQDPTSHFWHLLQSGMEDVLT